MYMREFDVPAVLCLNFANVKWRVGKYKSSAEIIISRSNGEIAAFICEPKPSKDFCESIRNTSTHERMSWRSGVHHDMKWRKNDAFHT